MKPAHVTIGVCHLIDLGFDKVMVRHMGFTDGDLDIASELAQTDESIDGRDRAIRIVRSALSLEPAAKVEKLIDDDLIDIQTATDIIRCFIGEDVAGAEKCDGHGSKTINVYPLGLGKRSERITEIMEQLSKPESTSSRDSRDLIAELLSLLTRGEVDKDTAAAIVSSGGFTRRDLNVCVEALSPKAVDADVAKKKSESLGES